MKLRDKLWIWGQNEGIHHMWDQYGLSSINRMTPFEGAKYFGISNVCRVSVGGRPEPPLDKEAAVLDAMKNVVWDVSPGNPAALDEILRIANEHPNTKAAVMDTFFNEASLKKYTPSDVAGLREKLHTAPKDKPLELWAVLYCDELTEKRIPYIQECDAITFWSIHAKYLASLERNFEKLKTLTGDKPIYCGCYMWDYRGERHMPLGLMKHQLDCFYKWLKEGRIEGMVIHTNCNLGLGFDSEFYTRKWVDDFADEEI